MKARRDGVILLIAIFKLAKSITLIAAGIGAFRLLDPVFAARFDEWLEHVQLAPGRRIVAYLSGPDLRIKTLGAVAFAYAILFLVEGTGLLMRKRWGEWMTIIVTGSLLPFEIYEIFKGASAAKIATVIVNAAVVIYLVIRVRKRAYTLPGPEK